MGVREYLEEKKRQKVEGVRSVIPSTPVEVAAEPDPVPPPKPAKPAKDPASVITRSCGCRIGVAYLEKSDCPGCLNRRRKDKNRKRREANAAKEPAATALGRLPHGSEFLAAWSAEEMLWSGTICVPGMLDIEGKAESIKALLHMLDGYYRRAVEGGAS